MKLEEGEGPSGEDKMAVAGSTVPTVSHSQNNKSEEDENQQQKSSPTDLMSSLSACFNTLSLESTANNSITPTASTDHLPEGTSDVTSPTATSPPGGGEETACDPLAAVAGKEEEEKETNRQRTEREGVGEKKRVATAKKSSRLPTPSSQLKNCSTFTRSVSHSSTCKVKVGTHTCFFWTCTAGDEQSAGRDA